MTMNRNLFADFVSASGLSRKLDIPEKKILNAIRVGTITPDSTGCNRIHLFSLNRLQELGRALRGNHVEVAL